ncbi:MAG TPA: YdiU family protein [Burkholderiaceae bacterium]|nr:YdiU family protein [Burkholderiaceae bacterium]
MTSTDITDTVQTPLWSKQPSLPNTFARLPETFYTRLTPAGLPSPYLVAVSDDAAHLLGLEGNALALQEFVDVFAGNQPLPGGAPLAAVYSGHQFGVWAGQLGDGRAHLLGEVQGPHGAWEIQLKGAGRTPYSRMGDGRAVLRSSIREFLCSEAMAGLGIPTTRALCIVGADLPVRRETIETAAVVTRLSPSFVRFGSFEHWAAQGVNENAPKPELKQLADYVIDTFMPESRDHSSPYASLLREVSRRTGVLIAHWQAVGFMHGVMNTDNMSILGLTLDYGPFGFMEAFDAAHICNHSDHAGRYAYARQPEVAHWNLYALGSALLPLIGDEDVARAAIEEGFAPAYDETFAALIRAKLGLVATHANDEAFMTSTFAFLQAHRPDYTLFFRGLSHLPNQAAPHSDDAVRDLFIDRAACDAWLATWRDRLNAEQSNEAARRTRMLRANPKYVLRNWLAENAIRKARDKDYSEIASLLQCLRRPYDEQPEFAHYAALPPDWASGLEVSCSS